MSAEASFHNVLRIKGGLIRWSSFWLGWIACAWLGVLTPGSFSWWKVAVMLGSTATWLWVASRERKQSVKAAVAAVDSLCAHLKRDTDHPSATGPSKPPRVH